MKRLRIILILSLAAAALAVTVASWNLWALYSHEKEQTMTNVGKYAENAFVLEMIGRMKSSEKAPESFIRLNDFMESAQQKNGIPAESDTLRTSLVSILCSGLEFENNSWQPDPEKLDSIFSAELLRNGLDAGEAYIRDSDSQSPEFASLWMTTYKISPSSSGCLCHSTVQVRPQSHVGHNNSFRGVNSDIHLSVALSHRTDKEDEDFGADEG